MYKGVIYWDASGSSSRSLAWELCNVQRVLFPGDLRFSGMHWTSMALEPVEPETSPATLHCTRSLRILWLSCTRRMLGSSSLPAMLPTIQHCTRWARPCQVVLAILHPLAFSRCWCDLLPGCVGGVQNQVRLTAWALWVEGDHYTVVDFLHLKRLRINVFEDLHSGCWLNIDVDISPM